MMLEKKQNPARQARALSAEAHGGKEIKMKALLSFSIEVDQNKRMDLKLYRTDKGLEWRCGGELGDVAETLPEPKSIESAKLDAIAMYGKSTGPGGWNMKAVWH